MEEHRRLLCVAADIRCSGLCVRAMRAVRCACLIWRENRWPLALGQKEYVDSFAISARCDDATIIVYNKNAIITGARPQRTR